MGKHRKNKISSGALPEAENAPPSVQTDPVKEKNAAPGAAEPACVLPEGESVAEREAPAEPVKKKGIFGWKIFRYRFLTLMLMCIIMSFIGFLVENIFRFFRAGVINSRRQFLPFLFAYGIAVFALYVVVGTPREMRFFGWKLFKKNSKLSVTAKYFLYWLILFAGVFFGEILFGTFVEWVSGIVLWDYTGIPLSFTKYTSIPTALGLSAGVMLFMRFIFEPLMKKLDKIPDKVLLGIDIGLGVPIVIDWLIMLVLMLGFGISKNWWIIQVW